METKFILLVEDNCNDELLAKRAFQRNRIPNRLVVVRDGAEALDFLFGTGAHVGRNLKEQPALVLLDLKLPKVDGLEVLRRLRAVEHTSALPVVVLSSSDEEGDLRESHRLGVDSYIRKPVNFKEFVEAIGLLGVHWLKLEDSTGAPGGMKLP
ncbi:MAG: two-component system response regulator [Pedosphaera sp.]|nr:two-component system response regulator [Pedosphaera sp.]